MRLLWRSVLASLDQRNTTEFHQQTLCARNKDSREWGDGEPSPIPHGCICFAKGAWTAKPSDGNNRRLPAHFALAAPVGRGIIMRYWFLGFAFLVHDFLPSHPGLLVIGGIEL